MAWTVQFNDGVYLPQIDWWLDSHLPVARSFVSHAHSDHTATHREILSSAGTARLMRARLPGERIEHILPFGQTEQLTADCTVTLHPAGHIFGSAQSLLDHAAHGRLLYTGDFKLRRGLSAEPCATPHTDVLIMETTFGRPHYVFPPTDKVLLDIAHFCHEALSEGITPVLFGYSLGKSQELLTGLAAAQLPVMLHPQTFKLTRVYEEFGIQFPPYREFNYDELAGHVVICPPQSRDSFFVRKIPQRRTAVITGWAIDSGAIYRYQTDAAFPLSDHADFPDLLRFVEAVQPKRVLTLHGFAQEFAQVLRDRGIEAWAVDRDNQLELGIAASTQADHSVSGDSVGKTAPPSSDRVSEDVPPLSQFPTGNLDDTVVAQHLADASHADSFARFARVADAVKATPRKLEKIALLQAYLASLSPDDAATAAIFFTGRSFPQTDQRNLNLGWAVIKRAVLDVGGVTEADLYAAYRRFADTGDATAAVLKQRRVSSRSAQQSAAGPSLEDATGVRSLGDVAQFFAAVTDARGPAAKLEHLRTMLALISPHEARYLVKIITGDLRIGLKEGLLEEAVAAASGEPLDSVREANMLSGDIAAVTRAARIHQLDTIELTVFRPLQFMLASPEPTAEAIVARFAERNAETQEALPAKDSSGNATPSLISTREDGVAGPNGGTTSVSSGLEAEDTEVVSPSPTRSLSIWLEEKYDGIRCQLHKSGTRVELYSRDLNRITEQFPDLIRAAAGITGDFIADGELLAWRDGRALPFAELQKRLGRKGGDDFFLGNEIPVSISFYDLLWLNGRALLKEPLKLRRDLLVALLSDQNPAAATFPFVVAPVQFASSATEIEAAFLAARARGNEGLIAKDPASFYTPGRRGLAWLKLKKAYATLDVVVVGVEYGHGKRRDVLSDYTFAIRDTENDRLLTIGKAYSGLTDVEIATLTQHFLDHTIEDHGRYRTVVPDTVLEIAFDTIQPSNRHQSGYALRFPRIARIRTDKTPADIDTLETCRRLAAATFAATSLPPK